MRKKLVILGAGGHGRVCAEIASMTGYEEIVFLDDGAPSDVSVSGKIEEPLQHSSTPLRQSRPARRSGAER